MEEDEIIVNRDWGKPRTPCFKQEWFYGPYQSLTSEEICLSDPAWLSEAISQKIIDGSQKIVDLKFYFESRLRKFAEINPEFSISLEAEKVIAERRAKYEAKRELEKKEMERIKVIMAARELKYNSWNEEAIAANKEEMHKLIGWWFKPKDVKLEFGKYKGYMPLEILDKHPEDAMEAFSNAIINHYYFLHESEIHWLKQYCPSFKLSDEAEEIYKYEMEVHKNELASPPVARSARHD